MKKGLVVILLSLALLLVATPLLADKPAHTGGQINVLFGTPETYPAGEAFFVGHGWLFYPNEYPPGLFDFQLDIDGQYQTMDHFFSKRDGDLIIRFWLFNYPEGMTGTHTFTGHWFAPCEFAVDAGYYPGPCPHPNEVVEANTLSLTVDFMP